VAATIHFWMGEWKTEKQEYSAALKHIEKAITFAEKDSKLAANAYTTYAIIYFKMGDFEKSLNAQNECYNIALKLNDKKLLSSILNNYAGIYIANNQPQAAEQYILKSIEIERELKRSLNLAIRLGMASDTYLKLGKPQQALTYIKEAYTIDSTDKREEKSAIRLSQMAAVYTELSNEEKAKEALIKAKEILEKYNNKHSLSITFNQLGIIALNNNNYIEAQNYFSQAAKLSNSIGNKFIESRSQKGLWKAYKTTDSQKSLQHLEQYCYLADSIFTQKSAQQLSDFRVKYQTAEKEYQNNILTQKVKTRNLLLYSIITILVLILFILHSIFKRLRIQKKQNSILLKNNILKDRLIALAETSSTQNNKEEIENIANEIPTDNKIPIINFTPRQKTVIKLCCQGLLDKEIADKMNISIRTVDTHKTAIFKKLGINTKAELVIYAAKAKLLE
jgi:Response regulator containing a CheY-like receiver domain and an HTH DNA-binding domain